MSVTQFFLGANTPEGFVSLFDELYDPYDDWKMYIIKGGPGTGKSSLMKAAAKEADKRGFDVEMVPCSSDPLSLDGIIIPQLKTAVADGTSPHVIDPVFPGVCEETINMGEYWDSDKLRENSQDIRRITIQNSNEHKKCVKYLKAASILDNDTCKIILPLINYEKAERFAARTGEKELGKKLSKPCKIQKRFLSALTPLGIAVEYDTVNSLCDRVIAISDEYGIASSVILKLIAEKAKEKNIDMILCFCPMKPKDKLEHIIFPELRLCFTTANSYHPLISKADKTIHADRFINQSLLKENKNKLLFIKKTKTEILGEAIKKLEAAKAAHDVLESYYISAMDFEGASRETDKLIKNIFKDDVSRET